MADIKIPKHWQIKKLAEVADYLNGRAFKPTEWEKTGKPIIRIQNLNKAEAIYNYTSQEFDNRYKVERGELLYSWSASLGVYIWNGDDAWLNQHIFKVVPKNICNKKFLFYSLEKITAELYAKTHGSGMVHVTKGKFEETEIPFPSFLEQTFIVSKIEELLSDLENGKQQLQTAQLQLKIYRQSLLKWAFEGKLTNNDVKKGVLPKRWKWIKIEDIATVGTGATPLKGNSKYYEGGNIAWVTSGALNEEYVKEATDFVSDVALKETNLSIYPKNTLLLAMYGEGKTRGKCSELLIEATTNQAIAAIHFKNHDIRVKSFLKYFLLKNYNDIRRLSSGGVQPNLNLGIVKKTLFPFPPLKEQNYIVNELDSRLTVCDKIEETINQSLLQTETLRQSIFKKAFEGRILK
jgi:type I restriction enzyme S subunit